MTADIENCFIQSHELFYSRETGCSFEDNWLFPAERVPKDLACRLSAELHRSAPHSAPSGKAAVLGLPEFSTPARFGLGLINTL